MTLPQLGFGGGAPKPRKLSELSNRMAEAIPNVIGTRTGASAFGRMYLEMIFSGEMPETRAAAT